MNYRNDFDECLTYCPILEYYFLGCLTYFLTLINLLGRKVPKLLESFSSNFLFNIRNCKKILSYSSVEVQENHQAN